MEWWSIGVKRDCATPFLHHSITPFPPPGWISCAGRAGGGARRSEQGRGPARWAGEEAGMERRALGKTGSEVSIIGFGGIVAKDVPQAEADRAVAAAFDRGVTYFDVAPSYGDAEERLGPAL